MGLALLIIFLLGMIPLVISILILIVGIVMCKSRKKGLKIAGIIVIVFGILFTIVSVIIALYVIATCITIFNDPPM